MRPGLGVQGALCGGQKASSPWDLASVRVKSMRCGLGSVGAEFRGAALKTDRCLGMELTSESAAHGDQGRGSRSDSRAKMGSRLLPDFVSQRVGDLMRVVSRPFRGRTAVGVGAADSGCSLPDLGDMDG